jgi:hypothetical protein
VLFMSGYPDEEWALLGPSADDCEFLAKPFTPDQLLERVGALVPGPIVSRG